LPPRLANLKQRFVEERDHPLLIFLRVQVEPADVLRLRDEPDVEALAADVLVTLHQVELLANLRADQ
jgi:hypothetical protein